MSQESNDVPAPAVGRSGGGHVRVDPSSLRLDGRFFRRMWALTRPYWARRGALKAIVVLVVLIALGLLGAAFSGYISTMYADQTNALVDKKESVYWRIWTQLFLIGLASWLVAQVQSYMSAWLNIDWRRWLTIHLTDAYLRQRTYYDIAVRKDIDNPDERIQDQVGPFCSTMSNIPQMVFSTVAGMSVQFYILMGISSAMMVATVIYSVVITILSYYVFRPTIRQNWDATVAEADLRYGLLHVRDQAETIAFYRGEPAERVHLLDRIMEATRAQLRILRYQTLVIGGATQAQSLVWGVLPAMLVVPLYFQGTIDYGTIDQAVVAASVVMGSLTTLANFIPSLSAAAPTVVRLAEIQEKFEQLEQRRSDPSEQRIELSSGTHLSLQNVSVQTPGGEQHLVQNLSLQVEPGQHLVITGETGVGKSSLLRVLAGLWARGHGGIKLPPPEEMLFLPQRPYMIIGTLRDQLQYPRALRPMPDAQLQAMLERVNLHGLAARHGGWDSEADWSRILSLGEQQRIAFARVLISQPSYVFLDEATSAVDLDTEALLYGLLQRSGATFVSVGHRPSLFRFHHQRLDMAIGGTWQLTTFDAQQEPAAVA